MRPLLCHGSYASRILCAVSSSLVRVWNRFRGEKQQLARIQAWTDQSEKEMTKGGYGRGLQNCEAHE